MLRDQSLDSISPCSSFSNTILSYKPLQFILAGIELDDDELASFVEHVDKDNNGIITFEEWRDFLLLYPHEATIENIYRYWEKVYLVDIGEQAVIPEGISKHVHATKYLVAGGVAGAASRTATAPLDRLKVTLQVQTTHAAIGPAVKKIWAEGRFLGFFRGNGLNVLKVAPESAIKFYSYEMLKNVIGGEDGNIGTPGRLLAGGLAGAVAQTSIYPMDLVKTRLQTYVCDRGSVPSLSKLSRDIWVQEGARAFYRGLVPSLLGIIPYAGLDLAAYEALKDMSRKHILQDGGMACYTICLCFLFLALFFPFHSLTNGRVWILCSRTWSSYTTKLWDRLWSSWSDVCLSIAGYKNKVCNSSLFSFNCIKISKVLHSQCLH